MYIVIPAYQPDEKLIKLVKDLRERIQDPIVIVDDGSDADRQGLFASLESSATVLHHEVNRGKGAAIKTALRYIQDVCGEGDGIVTVDADGQHLPGDIGRVCEAWKAAPDHLVLGSRRFTGKVPFKSRAGNAITRAVFALSTGVKVYDTQTGLRAFSVSRIPLMLEMKGDRYEYEINVLLYATRHRIPIEEVTIDTVYIEENASSHFNPFKDAWRIYKMIFLFVGSSLIAYVIDFILVLLFSAVFRTHAKGLLISVILARVISSLINYFLNRELVFENRSGRSIFRYYVLAVILLAVNYFMLKGLHAFLPLAVGKIIVELILYPVSFWVQRKYVFAEEM